jgi:hypothetical protein
VSKTQFRQCLTYLKVNVTDKEFEILCKRWSKSGGIDPDNEFGDEKPNTRDPIKDGANRICYLLFLEELENTMLGIPPTLEGSYSVKVNNKDGDARADESKAHNSIKKSKNVELLNADEIEKLLMKLKTKAKTERMRVIEFMADFDDLKHRKITKNEFRRALKVLFLDLSEVHIKNLKHIFI